MSAIRNALIRLDRAINTLDGSIDQMESLPEGAQSDMFASKKEEIARKIESAIKTVETVLGEDSASREDEDVRETA